MARKNNMLNNKEMFELATAVVQVERPFDTWDDAIKHFSRIVHRSVSKANIENACNVRDIPTLDVVKPQTCNSPTVNMYAAMRGQLQELKNRVDVCEARLRKMNLDTQEKAE